MTNGSGFSADLPGKASARQAWQQAQEQTTQALRQAAESAQIPESATGHAGLSEALSRFADRLEELDSLMHEQMGHTETQLRSSGEAYQQADQDAADQFDNIHRSSGTNGGGHG